MLIFAKILLISLLVYLFSAITYYAFGWFKWLYHGLLKWHTPDYDKGQTFDTHNIYASCKHCGQEITQDSQGRWLPIGGK